MENPTPTPADCRPELSDTIFHIFTNSVLIARQLDKEEANAIPEKRGL